MIWVRIEFIKDEKLKYISHLDLMRVFERAVRRAGVNVAYSEGFNPRPKMVFGLPLPIGVIAERDYADIEIVGNAISDFNVEALNESLPSGLNINGIKERFGKENIMAAVKAAEYLIFIEKADFGELKKDIEKFKNTKKIFIKKERKGKENTIDIKDMIYDIDACTADEYYIRILVSAGSADNVRPDLFLKAFCEIAEKNYSASKILRTHLYREEKGELVSC